MNPAVEVHSIFAVSGEKPLEEDGDRIVRYQSAHILEAVSEKVIQSGHSVQSHPEAIEEIRRCSSTLAQTDPAKALSLLPLGNYSPMRTLNPGAADPIALSDELVSVMASSQNNLG